MTNPPFAVLEQKVKAILALVGAERFASYDYYDWWATGWGQRAKQWAYRTEPAGHLLFSLPILACEFWLPFLRVPLGIKKKTYPISIAHHGLACMELYRYTGGEDWLKAAREDAALLVSVSIPGAKGLCWGFPFIWSANIGVIPPHQPAATQTSYAFDLFEQLWRTTGEETYREYLLSIARAMDEEYIDLSRPGGLAHTYHGRGYGDVVANAVSYRMRILAGASQYGAPHFAEKAARMASYLLHIQNLDGSWLYGETDKNQFIDHFHTCFVLKNIRRASDVVNIPGMKEAMEKGLSYYWAHLFDEEGLPRPFAKQVRSNIIRYESYDFAECLGLFALFGAGDGFSREKLERILDYFMKNFMLNGDTVRFRIYRFPSFSGYPYFRFGMTAALFSLAQLLNSPLAKESMTNDSTSVS